MTVSGFFHLSRQASQTQVNFIRCDGCCGYDCDNECAYLGVGPFSRRLIAFTGLAGSGKSTAAMHLVERHGFTRIRFAGPLKSMMAALGLSGAQIEGDQKETPCDLLCGHTPRFAMQTIGTEWGRDIIGPDLWVQAWQAAFERTLPSSCIVVDDCRFPNEAAAIRAAGGLIVHIERSGAGAGAAGHQSEAHDIPSDITMQNNGSFGKLLDQIDVLARGKS